jgi:hypothetical protein
MKPSLSRRGFFARAGTGLAGAGLALSACRLLAAQGEIGKPPGRSEDLETERSAGEMITPQAQAAIDRGLAYLAGRQNQNSDGAFGGGSYGKNAAVVSLAGMAFMSGGSTPGRGPYGANVRAALRFVLSACADDGFITVSGSTSHGPMYDHGFATLFLAEAYGMTMDEDIRKKLSKAVRLIIDTQNDEGGWRYQPQKREADISVTICQVMALRAARNAGVHVPNETIERCIEYVKKSQNDDGGFMYMLQGGPSAFPRSAAGVVALYSAGIYEGKELEHGLEYLMRHVPRGGISGQSHYFYGHYYAVQAMWHAGGDFWKQWYPAVRDELIERQRDDGSWTDAISAEYGTAMACIVLQMPNNYLPIFQR